MVTMTAEVLHRNLKLGGRPYVNKEFKLMREKLLEAAQMGIKKWLSHPYVMNWLSGRDWLALRILWVKIWFQLLFLTFEYWAKETTKARNYLTHEGKVKNQSVEELIAIVDVTKAVVVLSVMRYIGVSDEYQKIIVSRHRQFIKAVLHARGMAHASIGRNNWGKAKQY